MNGDRIKGRPARSHRKKTWSEFAESHLNKTEKKFEELYRFLEERYGFSKEQAKEEVDRPIRR